MKARWISLGIAIGLGLALTLGFAFGSDGSRPFPDDGGTPLSRTDGWWDAMEAMHDSSEMRAWHEQMPEDLQARCDAMHGQMEQMMGPGGMMDGHMGAYDSGWGGGGMMGPRFDGPGGMMDPGGMMGR
ncbi:MAG TPA: hypothetical protein VE669_01715 [Actinomycetota bacterium]|jgi:hypothetical protein|nr:hypothetical protein [Actinomycetota bacterium]